tara:strand:+ start:1155 stop:3758 length:2604 start_codon:yes stop_codon:yes gene_type:complete
MSKLGRWPWKRDIHALMIEKLKSYGAEVIAYDILFSYPATENEDNALSQSTLSAGNLIYPAGMELSTNKSADNNLVPQSASKSFINDMTVASGFFFITNALFPFQELVNNSLGSGHIASHRDKDGSIRKVPLLVRDNDRLFPAFAFTAILHYLKVSKENIIVSPGNEILLKNVVFPNEDVEKSYHIPINNRGEMLINYAGRWTETFQHISFIDLYENKYPENDLKELIGNSLVIVSNSATGFDIKPVPVEKDYPGGGIHANIINTILTQNFINYPSSSTKILILFIISIGCALVIYNNRWQYQLLFSFLIWTGYLLLSFYLFNSAGVAMEILRPTFTLFISSLIFALWFGRKEQIKAETLTKEKETLETELTTINQNLDKKEDQINALNLELNQLTEKVKETETRQDTKIEELTLKLENELKAKNLLKEKKKELERKYTDLITHVPMKKDTLPVELEPLIKECLEHGIITRNPKMLELFQQLKKASETTISILLLGASGTGKELFARAVHALSPRSDKPFVIADLTTIPETLVESELFGHVKGAFTGAESDKKGKFQVADGGTIFLDEIGEMKSELQSKLLRVLQEGEFNQVGDNRQIKVNVRIIAATNCDVNKEIKEKRFREDLFYRINGITLDLPRLDERKEDIPLLAHHFVQKYSLEYNKEITGTSELATKQLEEKQWQGNIRELENIIQRAVALSNTEIIQEKDLGLPVTNTNNGRGQKTEDRKQRTEGSLNKGDRLSYEEAKEESFLNILRENSFSIDKVKRILKIERGSVSGRFKGICFKVLQECDGDIQKAVQKIAANNGLIKEVESKIYEYRNNLLEKIKSYQNAEQAVEEILKKEKNTKKKYLKYIEDFVRKEFYKNS